MELIKIKTSEDIKVLPKGLANLIGSNAPHNIISTVCNGLYNYIGKKELLLLKQIEELGNQITNELAKVASLYEQKNSISGNLNKTNESLTSTLDDIELQKSKLVDTINDLFTKNSIKELENYYTLCSNELENLTALLRSRIIVETNKKQINEDFDFSSSQMESSRAELDANTFKLKNLIISYLKIESTTILPLANIEQESINQLLTLGEKATNSTCSNIITKSSPIIVLIAKRFQLFTKYIKLLQRLIEEYQLKKIIKSDVIKTKKIIKQIEIIDSHINGDLGVKIIYLNMPSSLSKQNKNAITFYTNYVSKVFEDNCPSNASTVVKAQSKDNFTNSIAVALNSLSLLL